jgi:hypothetical protein
MRNLIIGTFLALSFNSSAWAANLSENKAWALALELSYTFQISTTQPVAIYLGDTEVISEEAVSPNVTREEVAYDFFLYPSDDDTLQIVGPGSAYLGCKAIVEFTQQETPSKTPDFEAKIISQTCEQSLLRKNPVTPVTPITP